MRGRFAKAAWLLIIVMLPAMLIAQQRDATKAPAPVGTAEITGIVQSADATPQPMRRAVVTLIGGQSFLRSVLTDDAGRFMFTRLPAGTYTVVARKAAHLAAPFGARRPGRPGQSIVLGDGQRTNVMVTMFRGASISGQLRDATGAPVSGVDVRAIDARTLLTDPNSSPTELATTDDRGMYRIFGLLPGDYYIVALPFMTAQGETIAPAASYVDSALAMLSARQAQSISPAAPASVPTRLGTVGFAPIFFPGTANHSEAARVHVEAGAEGAASFEVSYVTMGAIDGIVSGDIQSLAEVRVTLIPLGPRVSTFMSSTSLAGRPMDAAGQFRYANLAPGRYQVVARASRNTDPSAPAPVLNGVAGGRGGGGVAPTPSVTTSAGAPVDYLYGFAEVELRGEEAANVSLALQSGGTITGRIVFNSTKGTPPPESFSNVRASVTLEGASGMVSSNGLTMGNGLISSPPSTVRSDGMFEIRGIGPGRFNFTSSLAPGPDVAPWKLRSVMAGGRDLLDGAIELGPGTDIKDAVVTFSDARTEISGTLQSASGQPTTDYYIVALPADRSLWRPKSRRILSVRPATDGKFVFGDLPSGEYLIAALTDLDPIDLQDVSFLEQIAPAGVKVTITEGEQKVQNLRIK